MAKIQVTPQLLESEAARLGQFIGQHESNLQSIRTLVDGLQGEWTGEAQNAFYAQFQAQEPVFRNFREMLEKFQSLMKVTATTMRDTDQSLTSQIRSF